MEEGVFGDNMVFFDVYFWIVILLGFLIKEYVNFVYVVFMFK